jgi:FAD/FMN-containing dehydrogenase/Fe-S oxidoreductase
MISAESTEASQEFIHDLKKALSEVYFDRITRLLYSTDASSYQMMPVGVAIPRSEDEVVAAVEIAGQHGVPLLPRGGGSSLAGQAVGHALILDFSRYLDQILEINPQEMTVQTQPGITLGILNKRLAPYRLMFGPDPASGERATMGGILGNNSTGAHSIVYGMTVDHVMATDVVLADGARVQFEALPKLDWAQRARRAGLEGRIYQQIPQILEKYADPIANRYPKTFRSVAGYNLNRLAKADEPNLAQLMVGSEGTLGVVTRIKLNLVPFPAMKRLAMVHFAEVRKAMEAVPPILESDPTAIEVIDKLMLDLTRDRIEYRRLLTFIEGDPQIVLIVEYTGEREAELEAGIDRLQETLKEVHHRDPVIIVSDPTQQANVWYVRKLGLGILMSVRGDVKPVAYIEDAAVPVQYLADYVSQLYAFAQEIGIERMAMYGHASAGCVHIRPLINTKTKAGVQRVRLISEKSVDLVCSYGGTVSGEHGQGISRGEFSERLFGSELVQAFLEVKAAFDPQSLMNPGKVVNPSKMDDESLMRYGTRYATPYQFKETIFHFHEDGNFAHAVEMCNGAGVCRQLEQGVMCPSFQAMREEKHSTRGRANALRAAMMGLLGPEAISSKELYEILDLCLSCHGCKSECPSSVDMARLKAEFLYQYQRANGIPLRSRLFAHVATWNAIMQPIAPLSNLLLKGPGKWVLTMLGVHSNRSLPPLARQPFSKWYRKHVNHKKDVRPQDQRRVIFFHDTFTEHNDPQIGQAAIRVLQAAGYQPMILEDRVCCGRPAVSKGLLDEALALAKHNIALLAPYAKQDIPIIGVEPSCMAMLVDEYLDLVPGEDAQAVARQTMLVDGFLAREAKGGRLRLNLDDTPRHVLFHGHCQQKSAFGTASTLEMLSMIPNCTVEEIESGCCGMAGSFGYEREHYDLSIQLAEMSLAPAVRAAGEDTLICVMGTSCRDQVEHTTGRCALHPIEILASALVED